MYLCLKEFAKHLPSRIQIYAAFFCLGKQFPKKIRIPYENLLICSDRLILVTLSNMKAEKSCAALLWQSGTPGSRAKERLEPQRRTDQGPKVLVPCAPGDFSSFLCFSVTRIYLQPLLLSHTPQDQCFCKLLTDFLLPPSIAGLFVAKVLFK